MLSYFLVGIFALISCCILETGHNTWNPCKAYVLGNLQMCLGTSNLCSQIWHSSKYLWSYWPYDQGKWLIYLEEILANFLDIYFIPSRITEIYKVEEGDIKSLTYSFRYSVSPGHGSSCFQKILKPCTPLKDLG